jgi:hypothetical protein
MIGESMDREHLRPSRPSLALIGACSLLAAASASAHDYYVDAVRGSDANDGTALHPFKTLAPLLQHVGPCDHVVMQLPGALQGVGRYSNANVPSVAAGCRAEQRESVEAARHDAAAAG